MRTLDPPTIPELNKGNVEISTEFPLSTQNGQNTDTCTQFIVLIVSDKCFILDSISISTVLPLSWNCNSRVAWAGVTWNVFELSSNSTSSSTLPTLRYQLRVRLPPLSRLKISVYWSINLSKWENLWHILRNVRCSFGFANLRSSRSQMFFKIGVLKNFANFTRKNLCGVSF